MKRLFASAAALALASTFIVATPASAVDVMTQFSADDKVTPVGFKLGFDIKVTQVQIEDGDDFNFFLTTKGKINSSELAGTAGFTLKIDTDLDKIADYTISSAGEHSEAGTKPRTLFWKDGTAVADCKAYSWITAQGSDYGWSIPKSCLKPKSTMNIFYSSTVDGNSVDRFPDGSTWLSIKTDFLKAEVCNSGLSNTKRTYNKVTYVCSKSGTKWAWRDYGPIAAAKSKYLTEKAYYLCNLASNPFIALEDSGKTLSLEGAFKYLVSEKEYSCVARTIQMPSSVQRKIDITRALDGTLESSWSKIKTFWNYHPDKGLDITFTYN